MLVLYVIKKLHDNKILILFAPIFLILCAVVPLLTQIPIFWNELTSENRYDDIVSIRNFANISGRLTVVKNMLYSLNAVMSI